MAQAKQGQQDQDQSAMGSQDDMSTGSQDRQDNAGNFANDPQSASEAGQKGGQR